MIATMQGSCRAGVIAEMGVAAGLQNGCKDAMAARMQWLQRCRAVAGLGWLQGCRMAATMQWLQRCRAVAGLGWTQGWEGCNDAMVAVMQSGCRAGMGTGMQWLQ